MPRCPRCRQTFLTLEDEQGMHDCPYCALPADADWPPQRREDDDDDERWDDPHQGAHHPDHHELVGWARKD